MADKTTIETRLSEAETARHDLAVGLLRSWTVQGKTYTQHTISELDAYIQTLRQDLAAVDPDAEGYGFVPMRIEGVS